MASDGRTGTPRVHLHALCWNEVGIIPYFFRHYNELVDRFCIWDSGSTDGSLQRLAGDERVTVCHWEVSGDSYLDQARAMTNTVWQQSRGAAQWVFVVDLHEHLYHPDLRNHLRRCTEAGVSAIKTVGYQMAADSFPTADQPLWQLVRKGIRFGSLDKFAVFDPGAIAETNYEVGRHVAHPIGRVVWEQLEPIALLDYWHLGADYVCERNEQMRTRLRPRDIAERWGFHYLWTREEVLARHRAMLRMAAPVAALAGGAGPNPERLQQDMAALRGSGLFHPDWYLETYRDIAAVGMDPLEHFCRFGWREGRKPNPQFDPHWYMRAYGELIGEVNPLLDYVAGGEDLGRKPTPDFDPMEYRFQHGLLAAESPLRHFLRGRDEASSSSPPEGFDSALYLQANPDVAAAGVDPVWHFLNRGKAEGRKLRPPGGG